MSDPTTSPRLCRAEGCGDDSARWCKTCHKGVDRIATIERTVENLARTIQNLLTGLELLNTRVTTLAKTVEQLNRRGLH